MNNFDCELVDDSNGDTIRLTTHATLFSHAIDCIPNYVASGEFVKLNCGTIGRITGQPTDQPRLLKLQWYHPIANLDPSSIVDADITVEPDLSSAVHGIEEYVQTNVLFTVDIDLVSSLAFVISSKTILKGTFGDISGRDGVYYWRYCLEYILDDDNNLQTSSIVLKVNSDKYRDLGPPRVKGETLSERIMIGKKDECDSARDLLWKRAKIPDGKLISRGWRTKLREQQAYDTHQIQQLNKNATENLHEGERTNLSTQHATMKRHQDIPLHNLGARKRRYKTNTTTTIANGKVGYGIFRGAFNYNFGCGVRTAFPRVADVDDSTLNPKYLERTSLIVLVDHERTNNDNEVADGHVANVDVAETRPKRQNLIKIQYDNAQRLTKTSFRVSALPVGRAHTAVNSLLSRSGLNHQDYMQPDDAVEDEDTTTTTDGVSVGMRVYGLRHWWDDEYELGREDTRYKIWCVILLNSNAQTATIRGGQLNDRVRDVPFQHCIDNDINL